MSWEIKSVNSRIDQYRILQNNNTGYKIMLFDEHYQDGSHQTHMFLTTDSITGTFLSTKGFEKNSFSFDNTDATSSELRGQKFLYITNIGSNTFLHQQDCKDFLMELNKKLIEQGIVDAEQNAEELKKHYCTSLHCMWSFM